MRSSLAAGDRAGPVRAAAVQRRRPAHRPLRGPRAARWNTLVSLSHRFYGLFARKGKTKSAGQPATARGRPGRRQVDAAGRCPRVGPPAPARRLVPEGTRRPFRRELDLHSCPPRQSSASLSKLFDLPLSASLPHRLLHCVFFEARIFQIILSFLRETAKEF